MVTLASRVWYLSWVLGVFYPGRPYNWGGGAGEGRDSDWRFRRVGKEEKKKTMNSVLLL